MEKAVEYGKTIFIVGETGSGKTTYMKTLLHYIPLHLRLVTIEDNPEIRFITTPIMFIFLPGGCRG
jgi:type IV secretion system protein VirB11